VIEFYAAHITMEHAMQHITHFIISLLYVIINVIKF